jgi:hypothetical protein
VSSIEKEALMPYKALMELDDSWANSVISEGTLKTDDLITKLLNFIADQNEGLASEITNEWVDVIKGILSLDNETRDFDQEQELLEHLFNVMDAIAPEGCVFGSHDGDGACFGFWEVEVA